jgi:NADP-dependent 3-hydroxy acid dehydrogenase YdfG
MDSSVVIVITGASSGIGASFAELAASRGASLALVARRQHALDAVAARCHGRARVSVGDVTSLADMERVAAETIAAFGRIDVWLNNAGLGIWKKPTELTGDDIDEMVRVNVKSVQFGTQAALPHFKARGRGHVINISSMLGRMPLATMRSAYCGAKHFVNALTQTHRAEVHETHPDIQFSIVSPGVVHTDFGLNARGDGPDSRTIAQAQTPEQVADVLWGVVQSRKPDVYTQKGSSDRVAKFYATVGEDA